MERPKSAWLIAGRGCGANKAIRHTRFVIIHSLVVSVWALDGVDWSWVWCTGCRSGGDLSPVWVGKSVRSKLGAGNVSIKVAPSRYGQ